MLDTEPDRLREAVPLPETVTPPPLVADNAPLPTPRVTATELLPASTSAKLMPVTAEATSSVTAIDPGAEMVGASFTPDTAILRVAEEDATKLSVAVKVKVRVAVEGASLELEKVIARINFCTLVPVALELKVTTKALPPLTCPPLTFTVPKVTAPSLTFVPDTVSPLTVLIASVSEPEALVVI
jgi:hypothetical protein